MTSVLYNTMVLLVIDNYDSFTYNLVQYLGELGAEVVVKRNDALDISRIRELAPKQIVISPGPCTPNEAGISLEVVKSLGGSVPILGVCLGHQSIAQVHGGTIVRAPVLMHGKTSKIFHDEEGLFAGLPNPFVATRYHSLVLETSVPGISVTAKTWEEDIMALRIDRPFHGSAPLVGVQFHPESIMTTHGKPLLKNFLEMSL